MKMGSFQHTILAAFITCLISTSCHKEEIAISEASASEVQVPLKENQGTKSIVLTSSPGEHSGSYGTIIFEIEKVEVYVEHVGWLMLKNEAQAINTMELENGAEWTIAESACNQVDLITKIKLIFGDKNYLNADGSFSSNILELPIQEEHEVIVNVVQEINNGESLVLNLDLGSSIVQKDNQFFFKPLVSFINDVTTGIKGSVEGPEQAHIMISNDSHSYSTFLSPSREFIIRGIEEGTYDVTIKPLTAGAGSFTHKVIPGVSIVKGKITSTQEIKF